MLNIPMHRFKYTKLTKEQIGKKLKATASGPKCQSGLSDVLAGKSLKIVTQNGPVLEYAFRNKNSLTLSENGGRRIRAGYGALPLRQIVFFSHMIPNTQKGYHVFVDQDTHLATVVEVWFSSGRKERTLGRKEITVDDREAQRQFYFGYVAVRSRPRHCITTPTASKAKVCTGNRIPASRRWNSIIPSPPAILPN